MLYLCLGSKETTFTNMLVKFDVTYAGIKISAKRFYFRHALK